MRSSRLTSVSMTWKSCSARSRPSGTSIISCFFSSSAIFTESTRTYSLLNPMATYYPTKFLAGPGTVYNSVMQTKALRHDWTREEVRMIYNTRLLDALFAAQAAHRQYFEPDEVQLCQLLSIKTGGCPEDCAYCPQSAHYETAVDREPLLAVEHVMKAASEAREQGVTRFCMGAAWREVND